MTGMKTILMLFLTAFASVVCGSVLLIKAGGWLATLSAILIICYYFVSSALIMILIAGIETDKKKYRKTEEQNI